MTAEQIGRGRKRLRIYFDVSCLNRPFDDQRQARIHLESEAIALIFERIDSGKWKQVSSQAAELEIAAISDAERRRRVRALLPPRRLRTRLSRSVFARAEVLVTQGLRPADGLHVAAAEALGADIMLTCDDRLLRAARRLGRLLTVPVANPLEWSKESLHASHA